MEGNYLLNCQKHEKTVKPPVSDHPKCKDLQATSSPVRFSLAWKSTLGRGWFTGGGQLRESNHRGFFREEIRVNILYSASFSIFQYICSSLLSINVCEQHCTYIENRYQTIHWVIGYRRLKTQLWNRHPHKWSIVVAYGFHTFTSVCFSQQPSIHNSNCHLSAESLHNGHLRRDWLFFWGGGKGMGLIWELRKKIRVEKIYP